jgi:hypothetical protein
MLMILTDGKQSRCGDSNNISDDDVIRKYCTLLQHTDTNIPLVKELYKEIWFP